MTKTPRQIDPRHREVRAILRVLGPLVLVIGIVLTAIGLISFFSAIGTFQAPRYFGMVILGLPLIGIGVGLTRIGFLGEILRYFSGEATPVARDTFNTMAEGTRHGIETIAHAAGRGFATAVGGGNLAEPDMSLCRHCQAPNPGNAKFCNQCGTPIRVSSCPGCGAAIAGDARFCNQCGMPIA
jgi:hypothetical protein